MAPEIYQGLERVSPLLILWSFGFTLIHGLRIVRHIHRGLGQLPDNALLTELAGLPLTILQTLAFVMAAVYVDWLSMLLFLWWGPGFVAVLALLIVARVRQRRVDWHPFRYLISYLCKLCYLAYMVTFFIYHLPGMMFAFSAWIINDQYEKAFLSLDADRTRRTFHDRWLFRALYPAGLLVPLFYAETPWRFFSMGYGLGLLGLWIAGLVYVARRGAFFRLPQDPSLLRNMVYFPKLRVGSAPGQEGDRARVLEKANAAVTMEG
jgi:hypothetical protein